MLYIMHNILWLRYPSGASISLMAYSNYGFEIVICIESICGT